MSKKPGSQPTRIDYQPDQVVCRNGLIVGVVYASNLKDRYTNAIMKGWNIKVWRESTLVAGFATERGSAFEYDRATAIKTAQRLVATEVAATQGVRP